jgi:Skp family chaperone for outer membrane proteins
MRPINPRAFLPFLLGLCLAGCGGGSGRVAVIDLAAVAKATGHDRVLDQQLGAARLDLEAQLGQIAGDLEAQLRAEQTRRGGAESAAREREFQTLAAQARQRLLETQALAQRKADQYQLKLVAGYRDLVEPVAREVARSLDAELIVVAGADVLWFDPAIDITDEVIAELRAREPAAPAPGAESEPASAASDVKSPAPSTSPEPATQ